MRDNSSLTLVKDSHIWLKHSKMLYSGIYCLFLFIRTISFQKQAPTKVFPIVVTWAFARLSRHFESSCWHASATAPYNRSAIYTSYIYAWNDTLCQAFTREWARNFLAAIAFFACIGGAGLGLFCEYSFVVSWDNVLHVWHAAIT